MSEAVKNALEWFGFCFVGIGGVYFLVATAGSFTFLDLSHFNIANWWEMFRAIYYVFSIIWLFSITALVYGD